MAQSDLPHQNPTEALNLLRTTTPMLLTWPQLPQRSFRERIHIQSASGFPGLVIDELTGQVYVDQNQAGTALDRLSLAYLQEDIGVGELTSNDAAGLMELLRTPAASFRAQAITSYMMGPVSLALHLTDEQHRPLIYNPMLLEALTQHLVMRVAWLSDKLTNLTDTIIICLYEPFLDAFATSFIPIDWEYGIDLIEQVLSSIQGCGGLVLTQSAASHDAQTGTTINWSALLDTSTELLVIDMDPHGAIAPQIAAILPEFLQRSGAVGWGLVPAKQERHTGNLSATLVARFEQMLQTLQRQGVSPEQTLHSSLITSSTGLAHLSVHSANEIVHCCADVSARLRARYGLD